MGQGPGKMKVFAEKDHQLKRFTVGNFTGQSGDKYVPETANAIEQHFPGRIMYLNRKINRSDGSTAAEFDIELDTIVIQVKSGTGKKLNRQIRDSQIVTTKKVIGFNPDLTHMSLLVRSSGGKVYVTLVELLDFIKNN